ncbi:hypothetical protein, partial [Enterobacter asburiae]
MRLREYDVSHAKSIKNDFEVDFNKLAQVRFEELLDKLQSLDIKYIFLDMDGTIVEYCNGNSMFIDNWFKSHQFYYKTPLVSNIKMIERLSQRLGCKVFILSGAPNNLVMEAKMSWLRDWTPFVHDVFLIGNQEYKVDSIQQVLESRLPREEIEALNKESVLLIDDELENLRKAERNGYSVLH